ncbi:NAD-dependent epimerase/dehydratase family protein [Streptosporangium sp. KLBMP 9127]|nr:NAD(P)-dependent oxidoreductase [Streptosporangium sp. KLBMP 9127]
MRRITVTGGSGRLGRSVVRALAAAGDEVTSIDQVHTEDLPATCLHADLTDPDATLKALHAARPEAIIHLAAIAIPFSAPEEVILATNTAIAYNVVTAAAEVGATHLLAAGSPTVIGYGAPNGWQPGYLPIDEDHPVMPWNAYALSKLFIESIVSMAVARDGHRLRLGLFRPCFVISPEEWQGANTQMGHTVAERLDRPELAAVSLFNYVDARDAAAFVIAWLRNADAVPNGSVFFVGADDALAKQPLAELVPRFLPGAEQAAAGLTGTLPAFSSAKAARLLGWRPRHSWRTELATD